MAGSKIMIVDDEPDIVTAVSMRLRFAGYDVVSAADGRTAASVAARERPDLIILDIGMPGEDGHAVARRLKADSRTEGIPVIYLTARESDEDRRRAADVGSIGYLLKPFKAQRLLSLVERALDRR